LKKIKFVRNSWFITFLFLHISKFFKWYYLFLSFSTSCWLIFTISWIVIRISTIIRYSLTNFLFIIISRLWSLHFSSKLIKHFFTFTWLLCTLFRIIFKLLIWINFILNKINLSWLLYFFFNFFFNYYFLILLLILIKNLFIIFWNR